MTDEKVKELADKHSCGHYAGDICDARPIHMDAIREAHELGRTQGLEEAAKLACPWCRGGTPMSSEPDLMGTYHNIGTATDLDYRRCLAAEIRKLLELPVE